jgi:hypothetical protein
MSDLEELVRILIQVNGRLAFSEEALRSAIGDSQSLVDAYNLCDGTRSQAEVVKESKVDQGNFSRVSKRWVEDGILFRIGTGREMKPLHLYAVSSSIKTTLKAESVQNSAKK